MPTPVIFRGLNTELPHDKVRSGTAIVSRNVTMEGASIKGRYGFDVYDANAGSLGGILSMCPFHTAEGTSYVVVKRANGGLDYKKVYDSVGNWTDLLDRWSGHDTTNAGWWFVYENRLHYIDSKGVTKWHDTTTRKPGTGLAADAWKGGIASSTGPIVTAASGGGKEGFYHVAAVKRDTNTHAWSCIQDLQSSPVETRASGATGGFTVDNLTTATTGILPKTADLDYEWNNVIFYSSLGNTEQRLGKNSPSFHLYPDVAVASSASSAALSRADHILDRTQRYRNSGGTPPGSTVGCFNGSQAVYGAIYSGSSLVGGQVAFSLRGHPCMVPGDQTCQAGGVTQTLLAEPWNGYANAATAGTQTGMGYVGDSFVVFTRNGVFWLRLRPGTGGELVAVKASYTGGCVSATGCVTGSTGVHAIGRGSWTLANTEGLRNVARNQFTPTLDAIPATRFVNTAGTAPNTQTVAAYYGHRNEVWMAVARKTIDCNYAKVLDNTTYKNLYTAGGSYTYTYQFFPDTPANGDAVLFGWTAKPSAISLSLAINRAMVSTAGAVLPYYWNGSAWVALTITLDTTNPTTQTGTLPFLDDGTIMADSPSDWASATLDSQAAYWIKFAVADATKLTTTPILTPEGPSRILVFDEARGTIVSMYDPRNLLGAEIRAMTELVTPDFGPKMLIGLSDGRILSYPSASYTDDGQAYSAQWSCYAGQERRSSAQKFSDAIIRMADNASGVKLKITGIGTAQDTTTDSPSLTYTKADFAQPIGVQFHGFYEGFVYRLDVQSACDGSPNWELVDVVMNVEPYPKKNG